MIVEAGKANRREYTAGLIFGREKIHFALSGRTDLLLVVIPGRCPGLFYLTLSA